MLGCTSREAPREERLGERPDTVPATPAVSVAETVAVATDTGLCDVLALGSSWIALEERDDSLAIVGYCDVGVATLTLALASTSPTVVHFYGQDAVRFEVGARQEDDTSLSLEIRAENYPQPDLGTLRLVVRDCARGVVEVTEEIRGRRRPSELFVGSRFAGGIRRLPPADCGEP